MSRVALTPPRGLNGRVAVDTGARADLSDYGPPGWHLQPPHARGTLRLPSGAVIDAPSPIGAGTPGLGFGPQPRLWSFKFDLNVAGDYRAVSPRLRGPAWVDFWWVQLPTTGQPTRYNYALWYNVADLASGAFTYADVSGFFPLYDSHTPVNDGAQTESAGPGLWTGIPSVTRVNTGLIYPVGKLITEPTFVLLATVRHQEAPGHQSAGYVRIVEGVDPGDVPF